MQVPDLPHGGIGWVKDNEVIEQEVITAGEGRTNSTQKKSYIFFASNFLQVVALI